MNSLSMEIICYSCTGTGSRLKKEKIEGVAQRIVRICNACDGSGFIRRSKRKNVDGTWRKKSVKKSYPNFVAPGAEPVGDKQNPGLFPRDDEELCYLVALSDLAPYSVFIICVDFDQVGKWKIFQKLDRHRYSTDDLVTSWIACNESMRLSQVTLYAVHFNSLR